MVYSHILNESLNIEYAVIPGDQTVFAPNCVILS